MGAALALLAPHIPKLIQLAEKAITAPKSGDTKKGLVINLGRFLFNSIAGKLAEPPQAPSDDEIGAAAEQEFQRMKALGVLSEPDEMTLLVIRGSVRKVSLGEVL